MIGRDIPRSIVSDFKEELQSSVLSGPTYTQKHKTQFPTFKKVRVQRGTIYYMFGSKVKRLAFLKEVGSG